MNVLPRLSHIISSIPFKFPPKWFKDIKSLFTQFLWNNKKPRIGYNKLIIPRSMGGLGVPDIFQYYLSFNAKYPLSWAYNNDFPIGSWQWLEQSVMPENGNITLASMWYCPKPPPLLNNIIIQFSCSIVKQLHRRLGIEGLSLPSCPIWGNPILSAGGRTLRNNIWQRAGIMSVGQIYKDHTLPFQQLKNQYGLLHSSFLTYGQLAAVISKKCKDGATPASCPEVDQRLKQASLSSGVVSNIHGLLSKTAPSAYSPVQLAWAHDLNISLSASEWKSVWNSALYSSKCVRLRIIQFKILNRAYITPVTQAKMDKKHQALCWHECGKRGTLLHLLWECPAVKTLWLDVISFLSESLDVNIPVGPNICLLGLKPENVVGRAAVQSWTLGCLATKRLILLNWKERKTDCFSKETWLRGYKDLMCMERAASMLEN